MPNMSNLNTGQVELDFDTMQIIASAVRSGSIRGKVNRVEWSLKSDHRKRMEFKKVAIEISNGWTANYQVGWILSFVTLH
jgi:hypothetical protein